MCIYIIDYYIYIVKGEPFTKQIIIILLHRCDFKYEYKKKGIYADGHENDSVVAYRIIYYGLECDERLMLICTDDEATG